MADVDYAVAHNVAVITLTAAERRNALTREMARDLVAAIDTADDDEQVGAIVLGGGANFCAGAHRATLAAVGADPAGDTEIQTIDDIYDAFLRVTRTKCPTIAAVRGAAVGAGLNLALAADLRIVATSARLRSGFAAIGIHPGGGHFAFLLRRAGYETAAAAGLFGCEMSGSDAVQVGLAWQAVDDDAVDSTSLELARGVARDPELAREQRRRSGSRRTLPPCRGPVRPSSSAPRRCGRCAGPACAVERGQRGTGPAGYTGVLGPSAVTWLNDQERQIGAGTEIWSA